MIATSPIIKAGHASIKPLKSCLKTPSDQKTHKAAKRIQFKEKLTEKGSKPTNRDAWDSKTLNMSRHNHQIEVLKPQGKVLVQACKDETRWKNTTEHNKNEKARKKQQKNKPKQSHSQQPRVSALEFYLDKLSTASSLKEWEESKDNADAIVFVKKNRELGGANLHKKLTPEERREKVEEANAEHFESTSSENTDTASSQSDPSEPIISTQPSPPLNHEPAESSTILDKIWSLFSLIIQGIGSAFTPFSYMHSRSFTNIG